METQAMARIIPEGTRSDLAVQYVRPRGVTDAEAARLQWAITDRLEARRTGSGVMAQMPWDSFKRTLDMLLEEFEAARTGGEG